MKDQRQLDIEKKAKEYFQDHQYEAAATCYGELCETYPSIKKYCWQLGLCYLLQNNETEAQLTWSFGMADGDEDEIDQWISELSCLLNREAISFDNEQDIQKSILIRQHLKEIQPDNLVNTLRLLQAYIGNNSFNIQLLSDLNILSDLVSRDRLEPIEEQLVIETLRQVLEHSPRRLGSLEFARVCTKTLPYSQILSSLLERHGAYVAAVLRNRQLGCVFLEEALKLDPENLMTLGKLSVFNRAAHNYQEAIKYARRYYDRCTTLIERVRGNAELIAVLMSSGGYWQEASQLLEVQEALAQDLLHEFSDSVDTLLEIALLVKPFFYFPYVKDAPDQIRPLQNKIADLVQKSLCLNILKNGIDYQGKSEVFSHKTHKKNKEKIKIGYVSYFLHSHSVGWISRWLFNYHNHDDFEIHIYFVHQDKVGDFTRKWFVQKATQASYFTGDYLGIAEAIYADEIDILVDVDSLTSDCVCSLMALKPAPIQITWLGLDASGLPAIDYFIVDPHVVPDHAQSYYSERLWQLPQTYVAVDGFEVGTPTLSREDLNIPGDAVIYYSVQSGFKRHPEFTKLQLSILKQVPNSYLLIKGVGDAERIQSMLEELSNTAGISIDRLRFLPRDPDELTHRANLQIADIVLDTYPYNGATTTLETLWMGIPLVTRVGQQFAARNSYTMMLNAGIEEGISWTDEQYLEWGVRLGRDETLRQHVHWKLMRSRQTAPLWNAKQFALEMEKAYQEMWSIYQRESSHESSNTP